MANVNARRVEEILTSGITAGHYVAGSNITITENQDGTETIASTGGGGGGGFTPTETQLAAMNSGITEAKVTGYDALPDDEDVKDIVSDHFVAGSNITITDNVDGTQTIASTASGGTTDYSDLTNKPSINSVTLSGNKTTSDLGIDEVPDVTSSDDGKILKASYSASTGTYNWGNLSSTDVTNVLSSAQQNAINSGITAAKVTGYDTLAGARGLQHITEDELLAVFNNHTNIANGQYYCDKMFGTYTIGGHAAATLPSSLVGKSCFVTTEMSNAVESGSTSIDYVGRQTIRFIGVTSDGELVNIQNAIRNVRYRVSESDFHIMFKQCSKWKFINNSSFINATEYTTPTYDSSYVDTQDTKGGYVIANNICTVNIAVKFSSDGRGEAIASGLPSPAYGSLTVSASVHNTDINKDPGFFTFAYGDLYFDSTNSINTNELYYLNVSYLVDTST